MSSRRRSRAGGARDGEEGGGHRGAIIGAVGVVLAAVVAGIFTIALKDPPPPACAHAVAFDKPENGQQVDGETGVDVTGTVCGLADGDTVWVFEFDSFDQNFYLVHDPVVGRRPIALRDGGFAIHDGPIGDDGDKGKAYEIVAVVGGSQCRREIGSKPADEAENYVFTRLPDDCRDVARVQILVSQ